MQKYSHNSRRVQKELGGDVHALSERVDTIEEDVTTLKGYITTVVKKFTFDASTATEQTLQAVLENSEVMEWFKKASTAPGVWSHFTINAIGNTALNGTYGRTFNTKKYSDLLSYKGFHTTTTGKIMDSTLYTLKADTTTGALSYEETPLDLSGSYTKIYITFGKGEL